MIIAALLLLAASPVAVPEDPSDHPHVQSLGTGASVLFGSSCNVVVVERPGGLLLVDDQRYRDYAETRRLLGQRFRAPVLQVINTHAHLDHAGGDAAFAHDGAAVIAQAATQRRLGDPAFVARFRAAAHDPAANPAPGQSYTEQLRMRWGGERLRLVHVPAAHTDGDTLVKLERANVLHMGDVFFNGIYPHIDTDTGGTLAGNIAAIDVALRLSDARTRIVPGHGPLATRGELAAFRRMLTDVAADVRAQVAQGHDLAAVLASRPAARYRLEGDADQFVTAVFRGVSTSS